MATATRTKAASKMTSKAAAKDSPVRRSQRFLLLQAFYKAGKKGLTAEQAGQVAGLMGTGYWKRVSDLSNSYLIDPKEDYGVYVTRKTTSGRDAVVWVISEEGKAAYKATK
jgi:hypothetical protein